MKHICCYSGGHSSALVAIEVVRKFGPDNVILLNHDIHPVSEGEDIKRFKREIAEYLNVPVTYANAEGWETKDQFDVVVEAGAFKVGNGTALCTNRMKTQPFEDWLKLNAQPRLDVIYYGFDPKEQARIQRRSSHLGSLGFKTDYPLALWPSAERTISATEEIGIARPSTYSLFKHGNCVGCLKAGRQHWYIVFCTRPDRWEKAKAAEDAIGYTIINGTSLVALEPMFERMRALGVAPTEHVQAATFWAGVKKLLKLNPETEKDLTEAETLPCGCAT